MIVGSGPYERRLRSLAERAPTRSVTFVGEVTEDDLPAYYALGDVFAMPCRTRAAGLEIEGWGNVFLEAAACGRPVIVGDSGVRPWCTARPACSSTGPTSRASPTRSPASWRTPRTPPAWARPAGRGWSGAHVEPRRGAPRGVAPSGGRRLTAASRFARSRRYAAFVDEVRCPNCGALVSADAEWCGQCFSSLQVAQPEPPAAGPAVAPAGRATSSPAGAKAAATWPCPTCGEDNPIELDTCAVCGTSFAQLLRQEEGARSSRHATRSCGRSRSRGRARQGRARPGRDRAGRCSSSRSASPS